MPASPWTEPSRKAYPAFPGSAHCLFDAIYNGCSRIHRNPRKQTPTPRSSYQSEPRAAGRSRRPITMRQGMVLAVVLLWVGTGVLPAQEATSLPPEPSPAGAPLSPPAPATSQVPTVATAQPVQYTPSPAAAQNAPAPAPGAVPYTPGPYGSGT